VYGLQQFINVPTNASQVFPTCRRAIFWNLSVLLHFRNTRINLFIRIFPLE